MYVHSLELKEASSLNITTTTQAYNTALSPATLTRTGYTFAGWFTSPVGGTQITSSTKAPSSNTTYYAHWTVNKYSVICEDYFVDSSNNLKVKLGTGAAKTYNYGTIASGTAWGTTETKGAYYANYVYKGASSATVPANDNLVVYRYFHAWTDLNIYYADGTTQNGATVAFKIGNGSWTDVSNELDTIQPWGTTYYIKNIRPKNATEEFGSVNSYLTWDSTNSYYKYTPTAAGTGMNIYMKYKVYTITLDNQSATTAGSTAIYEKYNTGYYKEQAATNKMTTSANGITVPAKTGYTFGGYYTETNGGGTQYIGANGKLTSSASATNFSSNGILYAKWTENTYSLTFEGVYDTFQAKVISANGATVKQTVNITSSSKTISNIAYTDIITTSTTGVSKAIDGTTFTKVAASNNPTRTGYTLNKYNMAAESTAAYRYDGSDWYTDYNDASGCRTFSRMASTQGYNAKITLTWTEKTATLTYNANGHGTAPSNVTMKYTTATNAAAAISATGYTFNGWNTKADGSGITYAAGAQVKAANVVPSAITLYAQWSYTATPTITRSDYNTFTVSASTGSKYLISTSQSTKPAADASGWSTTASKDVSTSAKETWYVWVKDANGNVSANKATITNYKVTLTAGTGTTLTAKADTTSGTTVTSGMYVLNGTPVYPTGALNTGYNTLVVKKGSSTITNGSSQTISADTTFTSSSTPNNYTLTINPNGGTYANTTSNSTYQQAYDTVKQVGVATPPANATITYNGNGGTSAKASDTASKTFTGWTKSGTGNYVAGSNASCSTAITRTIKTENGESYENFKYTANNPTDNTWYSIGYPGYTYTSGHKYQIRAKIRVNSVANGGNVTLRHARSSNDWVALSTRVFNAVTNGWQDVVLEATFSGTTYNRSGTDVAIAPHVEFYTDNLKGTTASIDFDFKNMQVIDVTANTMLQSNTNLFWYRDGNGTLTANYSAYSQVTLPTATRTGYTFAGWYDAASGGNKIGDAGANYTPTGSKTIYAHWTANTYTVKYNGNGSTSGSTANSSHTYDTAKALTANGFSRTGYTFAGWSTASGTTAQISDSGEYSGSHPSGASNYNDFKQYSVPGTFSSGDKYRLDVDVKGSGTLYNYFYGNSGYLKIASWTSSNGNTGTNTDGCNTVPLSSSYTHYSVTFTLGSDGNGNIVKRILFRAMPGCSATIKNVRLHKLTATTDAIYENQQSVKNLSSTQGATVNLYATWSPNIYKVTLDNQNATTAGTASYWYKYKTTFNNIYYYSDDGCYNGITGSKITVPTKTGYTFGGYYTAENGGGTQYVNESGICVNSIYSNVAGNTTLYAKWTINKYYLVYDYQDSFTYSGANALDTGYKINWNKNFKIESKFKIPATGNRYCVFSTYDDTTKNGVLEITTENKLRVYMGSAALDEKSSTAIPVNTDITATFQWNAATQKYTLTATGTNVNISMTNTISSMTGSGTKNILVGRDERTTTFNSINISMFKISTEYDYNTTISTLPTVTKQGFTYNGWYDATSGGNKITSVTLPASNKTIYAQKTANELTFSGATLAEGTYGTAYTSGAFTAATNGTGSYKYTIKSGAPSGASIDGTNGVNRKIKFTNTTAAGTYNVVVTATDNASGKTKDATFVIKINKAANPIAVTATQSISTTYSTSNQDKGFTAATGAQGVVTYAIKSQKNKNGTAVTNFSIPTASAATLREAAKTSVSGSTYTVVVTATAAGNDNYNSGSKDITITVTVGKATVGTPTNLAVSTAGIVTWSAATNATGYQISIDNSSWSNASSGVNYLSTITSNIGSRTVYVRAVNSDTTNYATPSSAATKGVTVCSFTTVSNNEDYGTVNSAAISVISGVTYSTSNNVLTVKSGSTTLKTVTATKKDANGYTTAFSSWSSTSGTVTSNTVVTATFTRTANKIKLTLNANGGSGGTTAVWFYYNTNKFYSNEACTSQITSITKPTKTGYNLSKFTGDGTSGGNSGEQYINSSGGFASDLYYDIYKNATLTAQWTAKSYTLTLNPNYGSYDGSTSTATKTMTYNSTTNNTVGAAQREGYRFDGWYNTTSGGIQVYDSEGNNKASTIYFTSDNKWCYDGNATLYARWTTAYYQNMTTGRYYEYLDEAVSSTSDGDIINTLDNHRETSDHPVTISHNITLNTNGKTITFDSTLVNSGTFVINNANGTIKTTSGIRLFENYGSLTLNNGTYLKDNTSSSDVLLYNVNGTVSITAGTVTNSQGNAIETKIGTTNLYNVVVNATNGHALANTNDGGNANTKAITRISGSNSSIRATSGYVLFNKQEGCEAYIYEGTLSNTNAGYAIYSPGSSIIQLGSDDGSINTRVPRITPGGLNGIKYSIVMDDISIGNQVRLYFYDGLLDGPIYGLENDEHYSSATIVLPDGYKLGVDGDKRYLMPITRSAPSSTPTKGLSLMSKLQTNLTNNINSTDLNNGEDETKTETIEVQLPQNTTENTQTTDTETKEEINEKTEDNGETTKEEQKTQLAEQPKQIQIGENTYSTFAEAIESANSGDTLKLLEDINVTEEVTIDKGKNIILDLNGKTINSTSANTITNNGTLTISSYGIIKNETENSNVIYNTGTLNINNAVITASANGGKGVNNDSGIVNMDGGKIITQGIGSIGIYNINNGKAVVTGGIIETRKSGSKAIYNDSELDIGKAKVIIADEDSIGIYNAKYGKSCVIDGTEITVEAEDIENYELIKNTDEFKEQLEKMKSSYGIYNDSDKEIVIKTGVIKIERLKGVGILNNSKGTVTLGVDETTENKEMDLDTASPIIYAIADNTTAIINNNKDGKINFYDGRILTTDKVKDIITNILKNYEIFEELSSGNIITTLRLIKGDESR